MVKPKNALEKIFGIVILTFSALVVAHLAYCAVYLINGSAQGASSAILISSLMTVLFMAIAAEKRWELFSCLVFAGIAYLSQKFFIPYLAFSVLFTSILVLVGFYYFYKKNK